MSKYEYVSVKDKDKDKEKSTKNSKIRRKKNGKVSGATYISDVVFIM